jgi:hypothetical protein
LIVNHLVLTKYQNYLALRGRIARLEAVKFPRQGAFDRPPDSGEKVALPLAKREQFHGAFARFSVRAFSRQAETHCNTFTIDRP